MNRIMEPPAPPSAPRFPYSPGLLQDLLRSDQVKGSSLLVLGHTRRRDRIRIVVAIIPQPNLLSPRASHTGDSELGKILEECDSPRT